MKIGILGAGAIGVALAQKLVNAGFSVEISNSRGPGSLKEIIKSLGDKATGVEAEIAAENDVVILAVRWARVEAVLKTLAGKLVGKILIDATNPVIGPGVFADLKGLTSSEMVASYVKDSRVVKAFNTLKVHWLTAGTGLREGKQVIFLSGNFPDANKTVIQLISDIGFAPIEIGDLRIGGLLQEYNKPLALKHLVLL